MIPGVCHETVIHSVHVQKTKSISQENSWLFAPGRGVLPVAMPPCMGVATNTVGAEVRSLVGFCRGSASKSDSESTTGPLYAVDGRSNGWKAPARDAAACVAIYRPYVEDTAISWEIEVPTVDEMAARIAGLRASHESALARRRRINSTARRCRPSRSGRAAGTTSPGCNSSCSTVPTETQRPARSRDRRGRANGRQENVRALAHPTRFGPKWSMWPTRPVRASVDPERS